MSIIRGVIGQDGAVIDVLVAVSGPRERMLREHQLPIPQPVPVRAVIDTGSSVTGFAPRVFDALSIGVIDRVSILTPSTKPDQPHLAEVYAVTLSLISNAVPYPIPNFRVIAADCWHRGESVEALIGRDILKGRLFEYDGVRETFYLAF